MARKTSQTEERWCYPVVWQRPVRIGIRTCSVARQCEDGIYRPYWFPF